MRNAEPYLLGHSKREVERLERQSDLLRPITQRLLRDAGLREGMSVLDIGCGPGDVTMLAASLVGSTGRAVGIDASAEVTGIAADRAAGRRYSNVAFVACDVSEFTELRKFDMVVFRYVLVHQSDPAAFLRTAATFVRRGGVIALHELDGTRGMQSSPRVALLHEAEDWVITALKRGRATPDVGSRLVSLFAEAGLPQPALFAETIVSSGDNFALLGWLTDVVRSLLPMLVSTGIVSEGVIDIDTLEDRLRRDVVEARSQVEFIPQLCGWTTL